MTPTKNAKGFTIVERMITLAIVFTVAAIAIPIYRGYLAESYYGVMRSNMHDMRIMIEDFRLDNGNYGTPGTQFTASRRSTASTAGSPAGTSTATPTRSRYATSRWATISGPATSRGSGSVATPGSPTAVTAIPAIPPRRPAPKPFPFLRAGSGFDGSSVRAFCRNSHRDIYLAEPNST